MTTKGELSTISSQYLGVSLSDTRKFIGVQKEDESYRITAFSESDCENVESCYLEQRALFLRLIELLKQYPAPLSDDSTCEGSSSPSLGSRTQGNMDSIQVEKVAILFERILSSCPQNESSGVNESCRLVAEALEEHLKSSFPMARSPGRTSMKSRGRSLSAGLETLRTSIGLRIPKWKKSPLESLQESSKIQEISYSPECLGGLSDGALERLRHLWTHKYVHCLPEEEVLNCSVFKSGMASLDAAEVERIRPLFNQPMLLDLAKETIQRLFILDKMSLFTRGADLHRMIGYVSVGDYEGNLRSLPQQEAADLTDRLEYFHEVLAFFLEMIKPSSDLCREIAVETDDTDTCRQLLNKHRMLIQAAEMTEAYSAELCQSLIKELLDLSEAERGEAYGEATLLSRLMMSLTQMVYTAPGAFILDLFPPGFLETKKGSPLIHYHFEPKGEIVMSAQVTLIPSKQLLSQMAALRGSKEPYRVIVKAVLRSSTSALPKWAPEISVALIDPNKLAPPFITQRLDRAGLLS